MNYKQKKHLNNVWLENHLSWLNTTEIKESSSNSFQYEEIKKDCLQYSIQKTKICRLKASDRLNMYNNITNWIISLLSLSLIVLPVYDLALPDVLKESKGFLVFVEISLAAMILVFSLMISNFNYAVRALRFHQCAVELSALDRKLNFIKVNVKSLRSIDNFKQIYHEYTSILTKYENHSFIDYAEYKKYDSLINPCSQSAKDDKSKTTNIFIGKNILGLLPQWLLLGSAICLIVILFIK